MSYPCLTELNLNVESKSESYVLHPLLAPQCVNLLRDTLRRSKASKHSDSVDSVVVEQRKQTIIEALKHIGSKAGEMRIRTSLP